MTGSLLSSVLDSEPILTSLRVQPKSVLMIEDDPVLETALPRVIQSIAPGAEVTWVSSAEAALLEVRSALVAGDRKFDLIVADIFLEGKITGLDFWSTCERLCPEVPVLIMSSMPPEYFMKAIGRDAIMPPFLPKPFRIEEFRQKVDDLLSYSAERR